MEVALPVLPSSFNIHQIQSELGMETNTCQYRLAPQTKGSQETAQTSSTKKFLPTLRFEVGACSSGHLESENDVSLHFLDVDVKAVRLSMFYETDHVK